MAALKIAKVGEYIHQKLELEGDATYLFTIDAEPWSLLKSVPLPKGRKLHKAVMSIGTRPDEYWLWIGPNRIGDPFETKSGSSPDGELWKLSWAALPVNNGKYLVEKRLISYVVTGRYLAVQGSNELRSTGICMFPKVFRWCSIIHRLSDRPNSRLP